MQRLLYFLYGDADEVTKDFFYNKLQIILSELAEKEIKLGKIENSFQLEKNIPLCIN
ncbi:MAG: hypothetical protein Q8N03_14915 [Ignavibacteria bacterium]|jgi:hypothetical protein|nr:hypothetical protein [Ignavibacteria bacterium]MDP3832060.1 hypothetical protein [Ignavibacteriaceae bacterium]